MEKQTDSYTPSGNTQETPADSTEQTRQLQLFAYPELTQCLDLISNLAENTKLIPLIKGQEGSGKTTLLLQLQSQSPEHWIFCRIKANPMMHAEQLYNQLSESFNLTEEGATASRQELLIHFESLRHEGALPIIAIDDAHLLPVDTIGELLQLQTSSTSQYSHILHIIIFATPAINDLLQAQAIPAVSSQAIHALDMPSLNSEQAAAYITHVLDARGILDPFALTPNQIEKIARASRGLPGRIESLLTKLPIHPATPQKPTEKSSSKSLLEGLPIKAIVGTIGLASVISAILLFQDKINAIFNEVSSNNAYTEEITNVKDSEITVELPTLVEADQETEQLPQTITPVEELEPILEIPKQPAVVTVSLDEPKIQPAAQEPEPPALVADIKKELPESTVPPKPLAKAKKQAAAMAPEPISTSELIPGISKELPVAPKPKPITSPSPKIAKIELKQEAWLLSQKPTSYTLQIVGLKDETSLYEYIEQHKLTGKMAYFKTSRSGHSWYPLLYGIYPGRSVAMAAQVKLSAQLRQKDIWIRNMISVHKEISANKKVR